MDLQLLYWCNFIRQFKNKISSQLLLTIATWDASIELKSQDLWRRRSLNKKNNQLWTSIYFKMPENQPWKLILYVLFIAWINIYSMGIRKGFHNGGTAAHDGFLLSLPLLTYSLLESTSCFPLVNPWCLNTSVDYGNKQYKSNSLYFIKINESRYIVLFVVSRFVKKLFSIVSIFTFPNQ